MAALHGGELRNGEEVDANRGITRWWPQLRSSLDKTKMSQIKLSTRGRGWRKNGEYRWPRSTEISMTISHARAEELVVPHRQGARWALSFGGVEERMSGE